MKFAAAKAHILQFLDSRLPADLPYHGLHHTLDVYHAAQRISWAEGVAHEDRLRLLTAALLHDSGFVTTYVEHELAGCNIAKGILPQFGYTEAEIEHICQMIMATRIPQSPLDHLGQILCDADLDYLGRNDFYQIGNTLFREFKEHGVVDDEISWNRLQVNFLSNHQYFTPTARATRSAGKVQHLAEVEAIVAGYAA